MTLERIEVDVDPGYPVVVGPGATAALGEWIESASARAIVTDRNVAERWIDRLGSWPDAAVTVVAPGEDSKSFETLADLLERFAVKKLDRDAVVVAFGGGVVGDLSGLAAALYMRGINFVQVPTTLLAQVDASVGGKTAVNLPAGKNLAGVFHQPRAVLADTELLATLSDDDWRSGLGEVFKTALIAGEELFQRLGELAPALLQRDLRAVSEIVAACVRTKASVVASDPLESGPRKALNLGHTFGHAIERVAGFGHIPHGIAVAVGCALAARTAERCGHATASIDVPVLSGLGALGLPTTLEQLRETYATKLAPIDLFEAMSIDKKGQLGRPRLVLPQAIGTLLLDVELEESELLAVLG